MSDSKQHSVWSAADLFQAARAGIPPRDSGRSPTHSDNWEATNAILALEELEEQFKGLERLEFEARAYFAALRSGSPALTIGIEQALDEIGEKP